MLVESLMMMVRNWLRVPVGASVRKNNSSASTDGLNDYVSTIVDITVDDICIGEEPLSVDFKTGTPEITAIKLEQIRDEFNTIVKWAARDLAVNGVSVYKARVSKKKNRLILIPDNRNFEFYLTNDKEVVVYDLEGSKKTNEKNLIVFINYQKEDLLDLEDDKLNSNIVYKINPSPMQVKNVSSVAKALTVSENGITKYRALTSRPARWVNVDVGFSQGATQDDVVNTISSAINAGSESYSSTSDMTEFDDFIPVIPNRKGIGKPEIVESIPNANLKDVVDLEYNINKLCLMLRFPASYIDFSKELGASAVSMIRSDLRYSKMCSTIRKKIETTINNFINKSVKFAKFEPKYYLTSIPSSEDSDVVDSLNNYVDLIRSLEEFLIAETKKESSHRLEALQSALSSTMTPSIQRVIETFKEYIDSMEDDSIDDSMEDDSMGSDF